MPRKAWLVGFAYVARELGRRRGARVSQQGVAAIEKLKGFPRPYYTAEQRAALGHTWLMYDKAMIDAFLARITDERVARIPLHGEHSTNPYAIAGRLARGPILNRAPSKHEPGASS